MLGYLILVLVNMDITKFNNLHVTFDLKKYFVFEDDKCMGQQSLIKLSIFPLIMKIKCK